MDWFLYDKDLRHERVKFVKLWTNCYLVGLYFKHSEYKIDYTCLFAFTATT